jgi:hypothetical protein
MVYRYNYSDHSLGALMARHAKNDPTVVTVIGDFVTGFFVFKVGAVLLLMSLTIGPLDALLWLVGFGIVGAVLAAPCILIQHLFLKGYRGR